MDDIISKVVAVLLGAIIIGAAKSYFFTRRLYLIQPKLFDYSDLASAKNSKTLELTIFNGGVKSEENVVVQLSPVFTYTVVASNRSGLILKDGVLDVGRIAPKEDVTIVLTAEGGEFRKEHVIGVSSKEIKGKIKASLQDAQFTPAQHFFVIVLLFVVFPLGGYLGGKMAESIFGELSWFEGDGVHKQGALDLENDDSAMPIKFSRKNKKINLISMAKRNATALEDSYRVVSAFRSGDYVSLNIELQNKTSERIEVSIYSTNPVSEERSNHYSKIDYQFSDVMVFPGVTKKVVLADYLPAKTNPTLISIHVVVEGGQGRVDFTEDIYLESVSE